MPKTTFVIEHKLFAAMLDEGGFATRTPRSTESTVNGIKLLRLSVGGTRVSVASISPDAASFAFQALTGIEGESNGACVNADEITKDVASLEKAHTLRVELDEHGKVGVPSGKVIITVYNEKQRPVQTWCYDAYDPGNVPALVMPKDFIASFNALEFKRCEEAICFAAGLASLNGVEDHILLRLANGAPQMVATDTKLMGIVTPADGTHKIGSIKQDFVLLHAGLLDKWVKMLGAKDELKILEDPNQEHVWLMANGFGVRLVMPSKDSRCKFPAGAIDRIAGMVTNVRVVLPDNLELLEAVAAAKARDSKYVELTVSAGKSEIEVGHARAAKPALVTCDPPALGLGSPMWLSTVGLLKSIEQIPEQRLVIGFNQGETRAMLRGENDSKLVYAFQKSKDISLAKA
jgi:hypothetical protein